MIRRFLNAKLRDIKITDTFVEYEGSITLDEDFLEKTGILPFEEVHVLNMESGARFITYAIKGERGSGVVQLNGPAAYLGKRGDRLMVLTYAYLTETEISNHKPRIVSVLKA
jgi:aspartate 1-decarboxylase